MKHPMAKALESSKPEDWSAFRDYLRERLSPDQRYMLALSAFQACTERDQQELLCDMAWKGEDPLPPFAATMPAAREWASLAGQDEIKAYAAASYEMMGERQRMQFLKWMEAQQEAAA